MKTTTRLLFIISLCSILFASQCRKDTSLPPSPPPEKYNYFACKVDGKAWESCMPIGIYSKMMAQYFQGSYFDIDAISDCNESSSEIYLKIFGLSDTGKYILGGYSKNIAEYSYYRADGYGIPIEFKTDNTHTGSIHVTKFETTPTNKISGTFECKVFNKDSNKIITITEGQVINVKFLNF